MIISDMTELTALDNDYVDLWAVDSDSYEGPLRAAGREWRVVATSCKGEKNMRLWIQIKLGHVSGDRDAAARLVADRGMSGGPWSYLCIDPRDGEMIYTVTLTCDMGGAALNRFFACASDFLAENDEQLGSLLADDGVDDGPDGTADDDFLSRLFS